MKKMVEEVKVLCKRWQRRSREYVGDGRGGQDNMQEMVEEVKEYVGNGIGGQGNTQEMVEEVK